MRVPSLSGPNLFSYKKKEGGICCFTALDACKVCTRTCIFCTCEIGSSAQPMRMVMILQVLLSEHKFCCGFLVNAFRVTCGPGPHIMCARSKPVFHRGDSSGSNLFRQTPKRGSWSRDLFPNYELLDLATMALPIMVDTAVRTDCLARQGSYFHLKGTVKACQNSGGKVFRKQLLRSFF